MNEQPTTSPPQDPDPAGEDDRNPMAQAAGLATQAVSIGMEMAVPTLLGYWLDQQAGTGVLFLLIGAVLGLITGLMHLVQMAKRLGSPTRAANHTDDPKSQDRAPP